MKILVAHSPLGDNSSPDDVDVLAQVQAVTGALKELRHGVEIRPWLDSTDFNSSENDIRNWLQGPAPDLVFNLVETIQGSARHVHHVPRKVAELGLPCTGSPADALERSSNKLRAKAELTAAGLPTPAWMDAEGRGNATFPGTYIVKSVWEHASHGLDADNVRSIATAEQLRAEVCARNRNQGGEWFAEAYVSGREFNVALLAQPESGRLAVQTLAPAEIRFHDFPSDLIEVVGFRAKWLEDSFEYQNTQRVQDFQDQDRPLLAGLQDLAKDCWLAFGLSGYARVDFRVDKAGQPWIIDVNANPCLSPDAGFQAALQATGITFATATSRILKAALPVNEDLA